MKNDQISSTGILIGLSNKQDSEKDKVGLREGLEENEVVRSEKAN
jgi:hypothetical protein